MIPVSVTVLNKQPKEEKKVKEPVLKNLGSHLPLITVCILLLSLLKQYLYYQNFNITITAYLGISELGMLLSVNFFQLFGAFIILFLVIPSLFTFIFNNKLIMNLFEKSSITSTDRIANIIQKVTALIGAVVSFYYFQTTDKYSLELIYGCMCAMCLVVLTVTYGYNFMKDILPESLILPLMTFCSIPAFVVLFSYIDIRNVEKGKYTGTIIKTVDSTYISTASSFYIGKTEKSVFIYNTKDSTTTILPTESIKSILLKENNTKHK